MIRLLNMIRGAIALVLFLFNCIIFPIPIVLFGLLVMVLPKPLRQRADTFLQKAPWAWTWCNNIASAVSAAPKVEMHLPANLTLDKPYLVISNHQTWMDIIVIYHVFNFKVPPLKFFMKKELEWMLPVAGLACKVMGFPFMERHSREDIRKNPALKGKDIETTRLACKKFLKVSSCLMNFVEGTRFTQKKHSKQASPFKHLLKPKAGGVAIVLETMHQELAGILDVTIAYDAKDLGFWSYVSGGYKRIYVSATLRPVTQDIIGDYHGDRDFRPVMQNWLNHIWTEKDEKISEVKQQWQ